MHKNPRPDGRFRQVSPVAWSIDHLPTAEPFYPFRIMTRETAYYPKLQRCGPALRLTIRKRGY